RMPDVSLGKFDWLGRSAGCSDETVPYACVHDFECAATRLVAVERASAMPLVNRVLGLHAELAGSQPWLEAADVEERGVQSCK
ncbi:hypothetical protein XENOCAPTIV_004846, partial [Xenoophorus captivus]